jgi:hypothetical protein
MKHPNRGGYPPTKYGLLHGEYRGTGAASLSLVRISFGVGRFQYTIVQFSWVSLVLVVVVIGKKLIKIINILVWCGG